MSTWVLLLVIFASTVLKNADGDFVTVVSSWLYLKHLSVKGYGPQAGQIGRISSYGWLYLHSVYFSPGRDGEGALE